MKKAMSIGTLFLLLIITIQSNAEMRIRETGITFPDSSVQTKAVSGGGVSAPLNLTGNLSTGNMFINPDGAIISGVNTYTDSYSTFGGYFKASGSRGMGVYGSASGRFGMGVYGSAGNAGDYVNYGGYFLAAGTGGNGVHGLASGAMGNGVYGRATNTGNAINNGGLFEALGSNGMGVQGRAANDGDCTNYGGYFFASGSKGRGVYASANNTGDYTNYGGYFEAEGLNGRGIYASASTAGVDRVNYGGYFEAKGSHGMGVYSSASGSNGIGVVSSGNQYDFYADGSGNYGSFTGAHDVKFAQDIPEAILSGMIVSATGRTEQRKDKEGAIALSSTLPTVTLSTKPSDKAVFGVIVSNGSLPKNHWHEAEKGERFGVVNALGEGRVWVTDITGKIEAGDYITTSSVPGYGQMQDDDFLHSYTLGKAIETIDWEQVMETVQHDGKVYKAYLIAVVYTSG